MQIVMAKAAGGLSPGAVEGARGTRMAAKVAEWSSCGVNSWEMNKVPLRRYWVLRTIRNQAWLTKPHRRSIGHAGRREF